MFQSALRSPDRSDSRPSAGLRRRGGFNPRSGHPTGATPERSHRDRRRPVSIRAPVTRPERRRSSIGDYISSRFQSALRSPDRSDLPASSILSANPSVSIRAPVTRPERLAKSRFDPDLLQFQSALRSPDRSDLFVCCPPAHQRCFNPRSGHPTGATCVRRPSGHGRQVSIRAPVTRPERRAQHRCRAGGDRVSIRAPVTRPERHADRHQVELTKMFQSALRSPDRSDVIITRYQVHGTSFNPRSGHPTGATRPRIPQTTSWKCFNPRSGHPTGATWPGDISNAPSRCFNPRSGHPTGATVAGLTSQVATTF